MNVYQKLNNARNAFHAIKLEKTGHNKFAGYKYFELGDFLIPALKVFSEHGLTSIVSFGPDMAHMAIINTDDPKDSFQITSPMGSAALKGCHEVQNIGAVETYQRRYLWVSALEIVEHDALDSSRPIDDGNAASKGVKSAKTGLHESSKSIGQAATETLTDEQLANVKTWSDAIIDAHNTGDTETAYHIYESVKAKHAGEVEFVTAVWNQLDSKIRSDIKKAGAAHSVKVEA